MFRPLMLVIFRLYMDLSSSNTTDTADKTYVGCFIRCGNGFVRDRYFVCASGGCIVWNSINSLFMPYL